MDPQSSLLPLECQGKVETFFNCHATHENVNLLEFEQKKNCDLILALSQPFFIGFWLTIPQNDQTDNPKKMAYSKSLSDQLIIIIN